jgi:hypothetical protein
LKQLQNLKDFIVEISMLVKACVTSVWFWVPVAYAVLFYLQLWLMFFVHPLTILIMPSILVAYLIIREEKRARAYYELNGIKYLRASHGLGEGPEPKPFKWEIERSLRDYEEMLKKGHTEDKSSE